MNHGWFTRYEGIHQSIAQPRNLASRLTGARETCGPDANASRPVDANACYLPRPRQYSKRSNQPLITDQRSANIKPLTTIGATNHHRFIAASGPLFI